MRRVGLLLAVMSTATNSAWAESDTVPVPPLASVQTPVELASVEPALPVFQVISPEREALLREYDRKDYTWPIVLTFAGFGPFLTGFVIHGLMHSCFDVMGSGCSAGAPKASELVLPIALMATGAATTLTGATWWVYRAHERKQLRVQMRRLRHREQFRVRSVAVSPLVLPSGAGGLSVRGTF